MSRQPTSEPPGSKPARKLPGSFQRQPTSATPAPKASQSPSGDLESDGSGHPHPSPPRRDPDGSPSPSPPGRNRSQSSRYPKATLKPIVSGITSFSAGNEPAIPADLGRMLEPGGAATLDEGIQPSHQVLNDRCAAHPTAALHSMAYFCEVVGLWAVCCRSGRCLVMP